ncbi:hypothetical protein [Dictyobacter kobayashii]|uniref:Uncharacterized protein n=1 Tax=Dictyobacter kobayashii TaxID=2014872 RepID=A0A402AIW9_9CHLR|nr:hypothetical protein [Dictyobacter kobayashii]GCE19005.1 hypothetical protein KDK_28050 [Dictyobacter kobayashii]
MKRRYTRAIQFSWVLLIALLLIGMATPVDASTLKVQQTQAASMLNTRVYLTQDVLRQRFQDSINQQVPQLTTSTINGIAHNAPGGDQGWIGQLAHALIQPSATLTDLTPQSNGFNTGIKLSLYPGDPKPTNSHMLVTFSILNDSTVQVSGQALPGSTALMTGPLTTLHVPMGKITSVQTTTNCGASNLVMGLQIPLNGAQQAQGSVNGPYQARVDQAEQTLAPLSLTTMSPASNTTTAQTVATYVEVPFSSLTTIATGIDSLPLNSGMVAKNIQLSTQNGKLIVTADIISLVFGTPMLKLGTATTIIEPQVANGTLQLHVDKTTLNVLIFTFPADNYNQQIQQTLNTKISSALSSSLTLTSASMGPNAEVSCAAPDSLLLAGTTTIN